MINNKEDYNILSNQSEKNLYQKAKVINTDNFEGNINTSRINSLLDSFIIREDITEEDIEEMWEKIEKHLVKPEEKVIIKPISVLEKYIDRLKEKELVYKECINCDSNMIFLDQAIQILKEMEAELTSQFLKTKI